MSNFTDFIGGGGGSEINDIKPINSTDLLYTDAEGNKWLRQGYLDTDTTTYPAPATVRKTIGEWDGTIYYSSGTIPEGLTFDGTNYWIVSYGGSTSSNLKKLNGTTFAEEASYSITASTRQRTAKGVCWDSTNSELLVIGTNYNSVIDRYNTSGTYLGQKFMARFANADGGYMTSTYASGITTDGTYIYTCHNNNTMAQNYLAKWSMAGVLQQRIELPSVGVSVNDLQLFDGNIYVLYDGPDVIISLDATTYRWNGDSYGITRIDQSPNTFCFHDTTFVMATAGGQPYYLKHPYVTGVGLGRMEAAGSVYQSSAGAIVNYTRIK